MLLVSSACSGEQFPGALLRRMVPKQFNRAPPLGVNIRGTAGVTSLQLGRNAGSRQGMNKNEMRDKIRKQLRGVELSPSSYDTAWVAMVPVHGSPQTPCFPQCIEWILQNQQDDGSWGMNPQGSAGNKEILLCTLACVVALKKWNTGRDHISRGLNFIGRNFSFAMDEQSVAPVGFNITFSGLLSLATEIGLEFHVMQTYIDGIFHLRKIELERDACGTASSRRAFIAYVSEGLGNLQDWDQVMAYQRKNGSIFNSPSTTAATVIHGYNDAALGYLDSLTSKFGGPVPAMYPQKVYSQLCIVDTLERTGISQYFACEISDVLDMTYRLWMHNEEELILDMRTCAMAFRLLRMHGYDITSDGMAQFVEQSSFDGSIHGYLNDIKALLELYKSSQVRFLEEDLILEEIGSWSVRVLQEKLSSKMIPKSELPEVEFSLRFPVYATLERLEHKRNIEQFKTKEQLKTEGFKLLKSGYCGVTANDEILALAVDEFHSSQSVYQQELQNLNSWVAQTRLDELKFARLMPLSTYFSAAATMFPSELSEARIAWTQNCILTTTADDFFDGEGSNEEMENLVKLIEKWDGHGEIGFYSECVEILFYAIYNTSKQIAEKAAPLQKRSVVDHIAESWWFTVRAMLTEAKWRLDEYVPTTMEEYMSAAVDSFALGPIISSAVFFVGQELSEEVVRSEEYVHLLRLANTIGRLLNDTQTYGKEIKIGKINSVMLRALPHSGGGSPVASIEEAKREIRRVIQASKCELLRLVTRDGGVVPRPCRELFWFMSKVLHFVYMEEDSYFSPEGLMASANAVILDPLQLTLPPSSSGTL